MSQVFELKLQVHVKTDEGWLLFVNLCVCIFTWEISVLMRCWYW